MQTWTTSQGDRLDRICQDVYGTHANGIVEKVLAANPGLADLGVVYEAGVLIRMPAFDTTKAQIRPTVRLWSKK